MKKAFLGLGSNLGDRLKNLEDAIEMIGDSIGKVILKSNIYETEPVGFESDDKFLNMAVCVETELTPSGILGRILMIESKLGRLRKGTGYSSRNIDIDILFCGEEIIKEGDLEIPHPHIHERRFVLTPLNDIASEFIHPVSGKSIRLLLKECTDFSGISIFSHGVSGS